MNMKNPPDLITASEARNLLGISSHKMKDLLDRKVIKVYEDPLDRRAKLVSKSEVLSLRVRERAA